MSFLLLLAPANWARFHPVHRQRAAMQPCGSSAIKQAGADFSFVKNERKRDLSLFTTAVARVIYSLVSWGTDSLVPGRPVGNMGEAHLRGSQGGMEPCVRSWRGRLGPGLIVVLLCGCTAGREFSPGWMDEVDSSILPQEKPGWFEQIDSSILSEGKLGWMDEVDASIFGNQNNRPQEKSEKPVHSGAAIQTLRAEKPVDPPPEKNTEKPLARPPATVGTEPPLEPPAFPVSIPLVPEWNRSTESEIVPEIDEDPTQNRSAPSLQDPANAGAPGGFAGFGGFGGSGGGMGKPGYAATWFPSQSVAGQSVAGQDAQLGFLRQNMSVGMPIWRSGGDTLLINFGVRNSLFSTDAILPTTMRLFPENLWSINNGLSYIHQFGNGWMGMLMTGFGSSSDKPFHSLDEMNASVGAFLRMPSWRQGDAWMLGLMYSPAGNLNFPIPLASYSWNYSERFQMNVGVPLALTWRPTDDWTFNLSYVPLTNVNARITKKATEKWTVYTGYENITESYFLADRQDVKDRFFAFEQRLVGGVQWDLWRHLTLDLNTGYSFGRYFGEGANQGATLHDIVNVGASVFIGMNLHAKF